MEEQTIVQAPSHKPQLLIIILGTFMITTAAVIALVWYLKPFTTSPVVMNDTSTHEELSNQEPASEMTTDLRKIYTGDFQLISWSPEADKFLLTHDGPPSDIGGPQYLVYDVIHLKNDSRESYLEPLEVQRGWFSSALTWASNTLLEDSSRIISFEPGTTQATIREKPLVSNSSVAGFEVLDQITSTNPNTEEVSNDVHEKSFSPEGEWVVFYSSFNNKYSSNTAHLLKKGGTLQDVKMIGQVPYGPETILSSFTWLSPIRFRVEGKIYDLKEQSWIIDNGDAYSETIISTQNPNLFVSFSNDYLGNSKANVQLYVYNHDTKEKSVIYDEKNTTKQSLNFSFNNVDKVAYVLDNQILEYDIQTKTTSTLMSEKQSYNNILYSPNGKFLAITTANPFTEVRTSELWIKELTK